MSDTEKPVACGICQAPKIIVTYTAKASSSEKTAVLLCERCDLSPDPPVRFG